MGGPAACTLQSSTPDHGTQKPQNLPGPVSQGTQSSWEALPAGPELQALPPALRFRHFPGPGPGQRCSHSRENKTTCPLEEEVPVHSEPEGNVVCSSSMEPGPPRWTQDLRVCDLRSWGLSRSGYLSDTNAQENILDKLLSDMVLVPFPDGGPRAWLWPLSTPSAFAEPQLRHPCSLCKLGAPEPPLRCPGKGDAEAALWVPFQSLSLSPSTSLLQLQGEGG